MPEKRVIIIGCGLAAMAAAEQLSAETNVIIFTKSAFEKSHSMLAQGGISVSLADNDHWQLHSRDTMEAGCWHNNGEAVEQLVRMGPVYIKERIAKGMEFDRNEESQLCFGREGAHSRDRILHAGGDATGRGLMAHYVAAIDRKVTLFEHVAVIDLIVEEGRCTGVLTKDKEGRVRAYFASHTILASGGASGLFTSSSGHDSISGDGLAIAYRAGTELADLEFFQFHPTLLRVNGKGCGLVSEAVRGEGARLVTPNGKPMMSGIHRLGDLAPRDIVSRAIFKAMMGGEEVFLDISMIENFSERFPTVSGLCKRFNVDLSAEKIPVIPGAHFLMGGVKTDLHGRTSVQGLYAVGEVACTGVHGANRLASNSLLEAIVFGTAAAESILQDDAVWHGQAERDFEQYEIGYVPGAPAKEEIRSVMSEHVGIVRTKEGLDEAVSWFEEKLGIFAGISPISLGMDNVEVLNMLTSGWLIASSARLRDESRGGHFRLDFPEADDAKWRAVPIIRKNKSQARVRELSV